MTHHLGKGIPPTFSCAACGKAKSIQGRRLMRVMGLRQFVCKECYRPPKEKT